MLHMGFFSGLLGLILVGIPASQILYRAGYSRWWILAILIPFVNIVLLWIFAFADWPVGKKGSDLERHD